MRTECDVNIFVACSLWSDVDLHILIYPCYFYLYCIVYCLIVQKILISGHFKSMALENIAEISEDIGSLSCNI